MTKHAFASVWGIGWGGCEVIFAPCVAFRPAAQARVDLVFHCWSAMVVGLQCPNP